MPKIKNILTSVLAIAFVSLSSITFAQTLPVGQDAGPEAKRFKEQAQRDKDRVEEKKVEKPQTEIISAPKEVPSNISFVLKQVTITGVTIFKPEDFRKVYEPYLAKTVGFGDLQDIFKAIEAKYEKKGYLTSSAYLPRQDIQDGHIEIRVAEGAMGKLKIEGNKYFSKAYIEKYFHIQEWDILNISSLEKDILRLNQNPDFFVKTVISPGKTPGTSDITLKATDSFPWHVGVGEDNQGSRLTGTYRTSFTVRSSNVSGRGDTLFEDTILGARSFGESISYTTPIGTHGTKAGYDITYYKIHLGKDFKPNDIRGMTVIHSPHVSWELALRQDYQANVNLGLDIQSITKESHKVKISDDQLRIPWLSLDITKTDAYGRTSFTPRISMGTSGFLGASKRNNPLASRAGSDGTFFKYDQSLRRVQKMPFSSYLDVRSKVQVASRTLPSSEQMQIGGAYSVRGYPEGNFLADTGVILNTEWVFPMYLIPTEWKLKHQTIPLRNQIEPFVFVDCGGGQLKKVLIGERHDQFLSSIGGGVQFSFGRRFSLRLQWAKAIGGDQPVHGSGPSTFYLTFQAES